MSLLFSVVIIFVILIILRVILRYGVFVYKSDEKMSEKVVIVTGANSGIGFEVAQELARRGALVILACRNDTRGAAARELIVAATGNQRVFYKRLDLASLASVRRFADDVRRSQTRLDVLVNNAGVFGFGDRYTEDGIVECMQINYFGHFLLNELLLPLLKKTGSSRIIVLTSMLHYIGNFRPDYTNRRGYYSDLQAYSNSKLCNMAYTVELSKRLEGSGVVVNAVHPGVIRTNIIDGTSRTGIFNFLSHYAFVMLSWVCYRDVWEGAQTVLQLCVEPALARVSGKFFVDGAQWPCSWRCHNTTLRVKVSGGPPNNMSTRKSQTKIKTIAFQGTLIKLW